MALPPPHGATPQVNAKPPGNGRAEPPEHSAGDRFARDNRFLSSPIGAADHSCRRIGYAWLWERACNLAGWGATGH